MIEQGKIEELARNTNNISNFYKSMGYDISREVLVLLAIEITQKQNGYEYKSIKNMIHYWLDHKEEYEKQQKTKVMSNDELADYLDIKRDRILHTLLLLNLVERDFVRDYKPSDIAIENNYIVDNLDDEAQDDTFYWNEDVLCYIDTYIDEIPDEFFTY